MPVTTSALFDFIGQSPVCVVDRREVDMPEFGALRRNVRRMMIQFRDSGDPDALELSEGLRHLLSNWLTAPIPFDDLIAQQLMTVMGPLDRVGARWGNDIRAFYAGALQASRDLVRKANPLREALQEVLSQAVEDRKDFRIYCHKAAVGFFNSLAPMSSFLHSAANYRDAKPFDLLIKVGPLRSHGWGSAPDALVSAPRFSRLIQLVWAGCADEEGFGYDPVTALAAIAQDGIRANPQGRELIVSRTGSGESPTSEDSSGTDEFQIFGSFRDRPDVRQATLVQIQDMNGLLYPPLSRVLSFDANPDAEEPIARLMVDEYLREEMFLVRHSLHDPNGNEVHAEHGHFSRIWKARLEQELHRDLDAFCRRLRSAGIDLEGLHNAVRHWARSPTTVIHAPQRRSHFRILIHELGIEQTLGAESAGRVRGGWWQRAWSEIAASRGVAIQAGVQGHEALEEELLNMLKLMLPEIRQNVAQKGNSFFIVVPEQFELSGLVFFDRICSIEHGFRAPDNELGVVHEIGAFEQWRA